MAGIRVVVCLPASARDDVAASLGRVLAPFDMTADNPEWRRMWDWWGIRGASDGSGFPALPGHRDSARLIHDDPRYDGTPLPSLPGLCAGGPRGLLDLTDFRTLSQRRATVRAQAGDAWELWQRLAPGYPPLLPWSAFSARHQEDPQGYPAGRVTAGFWAQPLLRAFLADPLNRLSQFENGSWLPQFENGAWPTHYTYLFAALDGDRADFERRMADLVHQPDLLTLDGWWIENGTRPVHGLCEDGTTCPHLADGHQYQQDIGGYLNALDDDVLLIKLKCHG